MNPISDAIDRPAAKGAWNDSGRAVRRSREIQSIPTIQMNPIEFSALAVALWIDEETHRPFYKHVYFQRNLESIKIKRRKKYGHLSKTDYLASVKLDPEVKRKRYRAYQKAYLKRTGKGEIYWRKAYAKKGKINPRIKYPKEHLHFLELKHTNYVNWWKTKLHRQQHPLSVPAFINGKSITKKIRRRLKRIFKARIGIRSCDLIGCSSQQLKAHLQSQFKKGMSWSNYGTHWHIDHIIPLSKFNLHDPKQMMASCHFSNLQPLEAIANLNKAASIPLPVQPELTIKLPTQPVLKMAPIYGLAMS
jgi:hypothetical protein